MNYFKNMQTIAEARADNPRAPDYDKPEKKELYGDKAETWIYANAKDDFEIENLLEELNDNGYIEVDL